MKGLGKGFTLVEMLIVVAVIAILAAIAYPSYEDYLRRKEIPIALGGLSDAKIRLEQSFMDNRTYKGECDRIKAPTGKVVGKFTITCKHTAASSSEGVSTPESYDLTAKGSGIVNGFTYTLDSANVKTSNTGTVWSKSSTSCWILKRDGSC